MNVTLRFFGSLTDLVSARPASREVAPASTVGELRALLVEEHPDAAALRSCMVAVNAEFADDGTVLDEGDEVAFLPPVSGG